MGQALRRMRTRKRFLKRTLAVYEKTERDEADVETASNLACVHHNRKRDSVPLGEVGCARRIIGIGGDGNEANGSAGVLVS